MQTFLEQFFTNHFGFQPETESEETKEREVLEVEGYRHEETASHGCSNRCSGCQCG